VKAVKTKTVGQITIRNRAEKIGTEWCNNIAPRLREIGNLEAKSLEKYTDQFSRLIKVSAPNNLKSSYESVLNAVTKEFRSDFILPAQQGKVTFSAGPSLFDKFLTEIAADDEGEYYKEALSCAQKGYFRAATVMAGVPRSTGSIRKLMKLGSSSTTSQPLLWPARPLVASRNSTKLKTSIA
jgi:hypothetical protein